MKQVKLESKPGRDFASNLHLLAIQLKSFEEFLQKGIPPENRKYTGLEAAFKDIFPVSSTNGKLELEYISYSVGEPAVSENVALRKEMTYSIPVKVKFRLKKYKETTSSPHIIEKEVNFLNIPCMTSKGSFIINGNERVIINQLHRSPGVIFEEGEEHQVTKFGNPVFTARIIPYRGAWVEFEFDYDNALQVVIDRRRKFPATALLRVLGMETNEEIIKHFYEEEKISTASLASGGDAERNVYLARSISNDNGEKILNAGKKVTSDLLKTLQSMNVSEVYVIKEESLEKNRAIIETLQKDSTESAKQAYTDFFRKLRLQEEYIGEETAKEFIDTLLFKTTRRYDLSTVGRYKINQKLQDIFEKLNLTAPSPSKRTLCFEDIIATIHRVIALNHKQEAKADDIDHLGNRRIRSVGELLQNQVKIGLTNMVRYIKDKMNMLPDVSSPEEVINTAPLITIINRFFNTSQLSQFLDQTCPLSELTHKRRLSAIGPGGLNRKRAGFEVRDVHNSHYGKICPIETPEGANIGLIVSPSLYARVNQYGILEAPYRKVIDGVISSVVEYLTADAEEKFVIAPSTVAVDGNGRIIPEQLILGRKKGEFTFVKGSEIEFVEVSSNEILSPSASLIPFIEHDDANRALMGANMQRQAVPLVRPEAPVVSTGVEEVIARDSFAYISCEADGKVVSVQSDRIIVEQEDGTYRPYDIPKFIRTNQSTSLNFVPAVSVGQNVRKGMPLTTQAATDNGALALGRNILVAFLPWEGYNYEDAIVISERLVKEDVFTSIHITQHEVEVHSATSTEMAEEITRDIPGVHPSQIANLDAEGIIVEGTYVEPGDILVGRVVPEVESYMPHEVLLRSIFGEKGRKFKDISLVVPHGARGTVIGVEILERPMKGKKGAKAAAKAKIEKRYKKIFDELRQMRNAEIKALGQRATDKDSVEKIKKFYEFEISLMKERKKEDLKEASINPELSPGVYKKVKVFIATRRKIARGDKLAGRHGNKGVASIVLPVEDMPYLSDGTPIDMLLSPLGVPSRMNVGQILETILGFAAEKLNVRYICPPFRSPDFEKDVVPQLEKAGLPRTGTFTLYDGRTGEPFMEKVTVGYSYMMKLVHMAEDKIHARSTGNYSMVTRQPVGGKSLMGGQRFGEMEVWAIEGYGAAHLLREFLTIKSDDIKSRQRLFERIIGFGDEKENEKEKQLHPFPQTSVPEAFQVLVRELQALGFKIELEGKKKAK